MNFQSNWISVKADPQRVFDFFGNLNNLESLMPEQIINWRSDANSCSFTIKGMTDLSLRTAESQSPKLIRLVPAGKVPFPFELMMKIRGEVNAEVMFEINADLNPMLAMMAKRPLQNLVEIMADKASGISF
jgi:hypothetical protein